jgi:DNA-binding NarL/FixJ family response regulator
MIRVLLVDDQVLFREALASLLGLATNITVVGAAPDGISAVDAARRLTPDVILMDLRMPGLNGIEATRQILGTHPGIRILVLTTFDEDAEVFAAVQAGAAGYLLKASPAEKLIDAITTVARGESVLQPSVAAKVMKEFNRLAQKQPPRPEPPEPLADPLSGRELSVLSALTEGLSNKEIAARLGITEGTVKNHMTNVLAKLNVLDRTQAALRARDLGLI